MVGLANIDSAVHGVLPHGRRRGFRQRPLLAPPVGSPGYPRPQSRYEQTLHASPVARGAVVTDTPIGHDRNQARRPTRIDEDIAAATPRYGGSAARWGLRNLPHQPRGLRRPGYAHRCAIHAVQQALHLAPPTWTVATKERTGLRDGLRRAVVCSPFVRRLPFAPGGRRTQLDPLYRAPTCGLTELQAIKGPRPRATRASKRGKAGDGRKTSKRRDRNVIEVLWSAR